MLRWILHFFFMGWWILLRSFILDRLSFLTETDSVEVLVLEKYIYPID